MRLDEGPASLIVVGGKYVGLEQGQFFTRLATRVTPLEALDRIAPAEAPEISTAMAGVLADEGMGSTRAPR